MASTSDSSSFQSEDPNSSKEIQNQKVGSVRADSATENFIKLSEAVWMYPGLKLSKYANVYEGEHRFGEFGQRPIAVKLVETKNPNEVEILRKLGKQQHIVSLIETDLYNDGPFEGTYIAYEKCYSQNLKEFILNRSKDGGPFDSKLMFDFSRQIVDGLSSVHMKYIVHKDLKPDNIFLTLDKKTIKIGDFGSSEQIGQISAKRHDCPPFGTIGYRPPESFGQGTISQKSDIFSLGAVFHFVFSNGKNPFGPDQNIQNYNIKNGILCLCDLLVDNPKTTKHMIKCMVEFRLDNRPTIWKVSRHPCWTGREVECGLDYPTLEKSKAISDDVHRDKKEPVRLVTSNKTPFTEACNEIKGKLQLARLRTAPLDSMRTVISGAPAGAFHHPQLRQSITSASMRIGAIEGEPKLKERPYPASWDSMRIDASEGEVTGERYRKLRQSITSAALASMRTVYIGAPAGAIHHRQLRQSITSAPSAGDGSGPSGIRERTTDEEDETDSTRPRTPDFTHSVTRWSSR